MLLTRSTLEKQVIQGIKTGLFTRKRKPIPLRYYSLKKALEKISNILLAKELAFFLSTQASYRIATEKRYQIAYNILPINNWEEVIVVQKKKEIKKFKDILCIDSKDYNKDFIKTHPKFMRLVLNELNQIRRT